MSLPFTVIEQAEVAEAVVALPGPGGATIPVSPLIKAIREGTMVFAQGTGISNWHSRVGGKWQRENGKRVRTRKALYCTTHGVRVCVEGECTGPVWGYFVWTVPHDWSTSRAMDPRFSKQGIAQRARRKRERIERMTK
jgi:hypothetical protein